LQNDYQGLFGRLLRQAEDRQRIAWAPPRGVGVPFGLYARRDPVPPSKRTGERSPLGP